MAEMKPDSKLKLVPQSTRPASLSVPDELLGSLEPSNLALILSVAADITLVLDSDGIISDRVLAGPDMLPEIFIGWPGKAWADTVTVESRVKIEQLMQEALAGAPPRWRQVNHPTHNGPDIPIRYLAMRAGRQGQVVAIGRDLRATAALQQRLVAAEQSIEQEYAKLRHAETRYRLMLQVASEAIIIVEGRSGRVVEANPAAATLLHRSLKRMSGAVFQELFDGADAEKIETLLTTLRATGRADDMSLTLDGKQQQAVLSSAVFRQENATFYLIRLIPMAAGAGGIVIPRAQSKVIDIIEQMPDGFVVTDLDHNILTANAAFLDMAQLGSEEQARGEPIERWLGRRGVDTDILFAGLKDHGGIRQFRTVMRGQFGTVDDIEVSGVAVTEGPQPCFGFTLRRIHPRNAGKPADRNNPMLRSVDELTKLVGKMPLKDLVRETTDIVEKLCIEAALQLNENNRASTADMLGLSRQSLYVKLHRYGIDESSDS